MGADNNLDVSLQTLVETGIISPDDAMILGQRMEDRQKQEILAKHKYNIWQQKSGYWCTWIPDESKSEKRRMIRKKDKKKLEDEVIKYLKKKSTILLILRLFETVGDKSGDKG